MIGNIYSQNGFKKNALVDLLSLLDNTRKKKNKDRY